MLAGGVVALAHDPEAQENYCGTLTRIVGDLFRKNLVKVTVATELLELARLVDCANIQASLLKGHLETLSSFSETTGVTLPIRTVVSALPGKDAARTAKIYAAADGTVRKEVFMMTGAREENGISTCRRLRFFLVFIDVHRSLSRYRRARVCPPLLCTHAAHEDPHLVDRRGDVPGRGARVYARFGRHFEPGPPFRCRQFAARS